MFAIHHFPLCRRYHVGDLSIDTLRNYLNTVIVAPTSAGLALLLGTGAAYGLIRFQYRPRIGAILAFIGCLGLAVFAAVMKVPWQIALVAAFILFIILLQTIVRRFKRSLKNDDIAFWLISQRMLPPVAVVIPIYILFQRVGLLDTRTALIITYTAINLPIVVWLMRDYFQTIPIELEECAQIDGASRLRIFRSIVLLLCPAWCNVPVRLSVAWNDILLPCSFQNEVTTLPLTVATERHVAAMVGLSVWF
jgi:multiple sugar transport system permease protein